MHKKRFKKIQILLIPLILFQLLWLYACAVSQGPVFVLDEIRKKDPYALSKQKGRVLIEDVQERFDFDEKSRLDARQMLMLIHETIEEMSLQDKTILKLFYYQQLSLSQVASIIGKNNRSTQVAKSRAKKRLKEKIEKK